MVFALIFEEGLGKLRGDGDRRSNFIQKVKLIAITIAGVAFATSAFADSLPKKITLSHRVLAATSAQNLTEIMLDYQLGLTDRVNEIVDNGGASLLPSGSRVEVLALDEKYEFYSIRSSGRVLWVTPESVGSLSAVIQKPATKGRN